MRTHGSLPTGKPQPPQDRFAEGNFPAHRGHGYVAAEPQSQQN
jgi:hypothetical protein